MRPVQTHHLGNMGSVGPGLDLPVWKDLAVIVHLDLQNLIFIQPAGYRPPKHLQFKDTDYEINELRFRDITVSISFVWTCHGSSYTYRTSIKKPTLDDTEW